jgi:transmembrane sensor
MNRPGAFDKNRDPDMADPLQPFAEALRERSPSREALLAEGKAMTESRRKRRKTACAGTLVLALSSAIWLLDPAWNHEDIHVAIGQRQQLQLADGSRVELNSGSHLIIEKRLRSRQLELRHGQALFSVVHADTPFIVRSQGVSVRDIGTVFDVRSDARGVDVGVVEGAVEVSSDRTAAVRLNVGQQLRASSTQVGEVRSVDVAALTAWRQDKLRFDGTPLREVIADLQHYRQRPLRLADAQVGELRLSGEFDSGSVEALIGLLPSILPVSIARAADGTVSFSKVR